MIASEIVVFRALRFLLCRLGDGLGEVARRCGTAFLAVRLTLCFPLLLLPRVELSLRDLSHLLAFGFALLAIDVGKILGLNVTLAEESNMALALDALRVDLRLVAALYERGGLLLCIPVTPAEVRTVSLMLRCKQFARLLLPSAGDPGNIEQREYPRPQATLLVLERLPFALMAGAKRFPLPRKAFRSQPPSGRGAPPSRGRGRYRTNAARAFPCRWRGRGSRYGHGD